MSSAIGNIIKTTVFGESHGPAIGAVMDAPPCGYSIDEDEILVQMSRRAPGQSKTATSRKESDTPEFLSGLLNGKTTGAPLAVVIRNSSQHSSDYESLKNTPRPSHADYAASVRFNGFNDIRGGGNFSGRLTAPLVALGSVARQILKANGITVGGHVLKIGNVCDEKFDPVNVSAEELDNLNKQYFSVIDKQAKQQMTELIEQKAAEGDSIGGIVEIAVTGLPAGIGSPTVRGIENAVSSAVFSVPAVKGIEFGTGFDLASMCGSKANDSFYYKDGVVKTLTNNNGGINGVVKCKTNNQGGISGGISNGMPLIIRAALKPTPSIFKEQNTVDLEKRENTVLKINGRHDPCIVPRALPAIEAAVSLAILDLYAEVKPL